MIGWIGFDLAERLHHIAVQQDTALAAYSRNFGHRLNYACLVVSRHDRNESGLGPNRASKLINVDDSITRNVQPRHFKAFALFQIFQGVQDGVMLRFVRDDVTTGRGGTTGETEHGEVARFRSTTCENQFVRFYAQQPGQLVARVIDGRPRLATGCMHA